MFIILYSFGTFISEIQYVFFKYQKNVEEFIEYCKDIEEVRDVDTDAWIPCTRKLFKQGPCPLKK